MKGIDLMSVMLIASVLLPMLGGAALMLWNPKQRGGRQALVLGTLLAAAAMALTAAVGCLLAKTPGEMVTLFRFSDKLSLTLRADGAGSVFGAMVAVLWPVTAFYSFEYMRHEGSENRFFSFFTISFGVVLGIAFSANFLTLYFFYELMTLSTLPMVMHSMDGKARYAGKKYLIYSMSGAAGAFIGIVFLLGYGETLNFVYGGVMATKAAAQHQNLMQLGFLLAFFGFGVKAAVFPFHGWLPDASVAPTPVSALLHAVAVVKSGIFAVLRLIYYGYGPDTMRGTPAQWIAMGATVLTIVFGSAMALRMQHLKRRMAYSTVSNLSYILFALTLMTPAGMAAGMTHMLYHAVIKITLFFCAGAILYKTEREYIDELAGFGRAMPVTMGAFALSSLALMGIPPLGGFVGKWNIGLAAAGLGSPLAYAGAAALVLSALLTALYMMTVVLKAYFPEKGTVHVKGVNDPGWLMKGPLIGLTLGGIVMAFCSQGFVTFLQQIAGGMF